MQTAVISPIYSRFLGIQPATVNLCQQPGIMICHAKCQTGPSQIFAPIFCFHTSECQICFVRVLQTDRYQKLDSMIIILRNSRPVICFQHPFCLAHGSIKQLYLHHTCPDCFRQALRILCFFKNMFILRYNIQPSIKDQFCGILYIFRPLRKTDDS